MTVTRRSFTIGAHTGEGRNAQANPEGDQTRQRGLQKTSLPLKGLRAVMLGVIDLISRSGLPERVFFTQYLSRVRSSG